MLRRLVTRSHVSLFVLIVAVMLIAVPTSAATRPVVTHKTPAESPEPFVIAAGQGCAFDVLAAPAWGHMVTLEWPNRVEGTGNADITLTNLQTGKQYIQRSRYVYTDTFDPATNTFENVTYGSKYTTFWPGDQGPNGIVTGSGEMWSFVGRISITADADTGVFTEFSLKGNKLDLCAILAP